MTNSERALIPGSSGGLPAHIERRTRIANRVLGELERQDTEAFFRRHPEFFRLVVSLYYPLEVGLIERFKNSWDWSLLSCNESLSWDKYLVERFGQVWDWKLLSNNEALYWTEDLLVQYQDYWNWGTLNDAGLRGCTKTKTLIFNKVFW